MPKLSITVRIAGIVFAVAVLCAVPFGAYRMGGNRLQKDRYQTMQGWQAISGRWNEHDGVFSNPNYGRGDMLIAQHSDGSNYSVSAEIRFDLLFPETHYGDAGLVIRASDPEQGVDSYQGYYAGIRPDQQTVILGRASYDWHQLASVRLASPVAVGAWYRVVLAAQACRLTVTVAPENGGPVTRLEHDDPKCLSKGAVGLRSFYAQASWRNVKLNP